MKDNNSIDVIVGDHVIHRHRDYGIGTIKKIEDGCNAVCWVDFNQKILDKPHLTICCKYDIIKTTKP